MFTDTRKSGQRVNVGGRGRFPFYVSVSLWLQYVSTLILKPIGAVKHYSLSMLYVHPSAPNTGTFLKAFKNHSYGLHLHSHLAASIGILTNSTNQLVAYSNTLTSSTTLTRPEQALLQPLQALSPNYLNSYGLWKLWRPPEPSCGLYRHKLYI